MTISEIKLKMKSGATKPFLLELLEKVVYGTGIKLTEKMKNLQKANPNQWVYYGTKEIKTSGLPNKINNVTDAYKELERLVKTFENANDIHYSKFDKLGDLHIYDNGRPMHYIPA